ncbi:MAG TPA: hypothetical protein VHZ51_14630 [Ktedonobacteraceae bacterium]|nr:hypothetical protein [Ktedonobacteraceae bacterium]
MPIDFPYNRYKTLAEPLMVYYPAGEEPHARWIGQTLERAGNELSQLFGRPAPEMEIVLVDPSDWELAPHDDADEVASPYPYWTEVTTPPTFVVPVELDPILGEWTSEKLAFALYHELVLAFLEDDPRPWPEEYPLWADEWQIKFVAMWLSYQLDHQQGMIHSDLKAQYADIFEPEPDGKTPVTVRGFDWFDDTEAEDYLCFELLLEQFAVDLLARYDIKAVCRFLAAYRQEQAHLLSDDVTAMLEAALGPGSGEWLEALVYF